MRLYKEETDLLKQAESIIDSRFPHFGTNKRQEITRLIYEISKRDSTPPAEILKDQSLREFRNVKEHLLKLRFPNNRPAKSSVHLPRVKSRPETFMRAEKLRLSPRRIFVEGDAYSSHLAKRFRDAFPQSEFVEIESIKGKFKKTVTNVDYNSRLNTFFIVNENYDHFKKCPCTKKAIPCGYHIFNLSFGCIYECTYCYLQEYTNSPGLIFSANVESFLALLPAYTKSAAARRWQQGPYTRIGTGEFSDSLMLDDVTQYSTPLIEFFNSRRDCIFEFKTKSSNIGNLLRAEHGGNIVVAWSLNPQRMIDENEFYTAPLSERIDSARRCVEAGYRVAFHFDPILYYDGWDDEYSAVVEMLFSEIRPRDVVWISLGTLRFRPNVKQVIESRFPENKILDEELIIGYDNKLRYPYSVRYRIYSFLIETIAKHHKKLPIYLCMEEKSIWRDLKLSSPFQKL